MSDTDEASAAAPAVADAGGRADATPTADPSPDAWRGPVDPRSGFRPGHGGNASIDTKEDLDRARWRGQVERDEAEGYDPSTGTTDADRRSQAAADLAEQRARAGAELAERREAQGRADTERREAQGRADTERRERVGREVEDQRVKAHVERHGGTEDAAREAVRAEHAWRQEEARRHRESGAPAWRSSQPAPGTGAAATRSPAPAAVPGPRTGGGARGGVPAGADADSLAAVIAWCDAVRAEIEGGTAGALVAQASRLYEGFNGAIANIQGEVGANASAVQEAAATLARLLAWLLELVDALRAAAVAARGD